MWKIDKNVLGLLLSCLACLMRIGANPIAKEVATEFIILHNNDMHARFEQTSVNSGKCTQDLAYTSKCYGGFARVAHEVRQYRKEAQNGSTPVIYLNAGDTYTGTPWFTIFKDNITAAFLNVLQPDAISLGNHEFDENVEGLVPLLNKVTFPVLSANLDISGEPELVKAKNFYNSTILDVNGVKVGVIGYLTPDTKSLTAPNKVIFLDEITSINKEAEQLKKQGINIIIALGHSGYIKDQEIALKCADVDIVIGGHTNTFLYNGDQPDTEHIDGPYPTLVKQPSGKEVPVVQSYAYTKYLGRLKVQFDEAGNLIKFDGTNILLNATIPRDDDVVQLLELYRPNVTALETTAVAHTKVFLDGRSESCRSAECNLGNLITDSMVYARVLENPNSLYWTDASIAFLQGGGIRSSIEKRSNGSIFAADLLTVLPFNNNLHVITVSGTTILKALERSAAMVEKDSNGGFLQMSGIHTVYNYNKPIGSRVVAVQVKCAECEVPTYEPLEQNKLYNVIVTEFLKNKGDGHNFIEEEGTKSQRLEKNDFNALLDYIRQPEYIYPEIEGRISIIAKNTASGVTSMNSINISFLIVSIFAILNNFF